MSSKKKLLFLLMSVLYSTVVSAQIGHKEVKVNVIHLQEDVGNKFIIYINDVKKLEFPDNEKVTNHDGKNYHKYGCYGTLKTDGALVKWRKVRNFKDGSEK